MCYGGGHCICFLRSGAVQYGFTDRNSSFANTYNVTTDGALYSSFHYVANYNQTPEFHEMKYNIQEYEKGVWN